MKKLIAFLGYCSMTLGVLFVILLVISSIADSYTLCGISFATLFLAGAVLFTAKTLMKESFIYGFMTFCPALLLYEAAFCMIYLAFKTSLYAVFATPSANIIISVIGIISILYALAACIVYNYLDIREDRRIEKRFNEMKNQKPLNQSEKD